ncbi:MAG: MoaD/ThiS family protein [Planctomycetaceae bacterium]
MTDSATTPDDRFVTIRLFAAAKERARADMVTVKVPSTASIGALREALGLTVPALRPLVPYLLFAVDAAYARDDATIPQSGEVVAFPPVSGG